MDDIPFNAMACTKLHVIREYDCVHLKRSKMGKGSEWRNRSLFIITMGNHLIITSLKIQPRISIALIHRREPEIETLRLDMEKNHTVTG